MHQRLVIGPTILAAVVASLACAPKNPSELNGGAPNGVTVLVVHGVVTNSVNGVPIAGVTVTLHSADNLPAILTDASGYFQFRNIAQANNIIVQFSKVGFKTRSATVDVRSTTGITISPDGGITIGIGAAGNADAIDASLGLTPDIELAVAGWVWGGTTPAVGATVVLFRYNADGSCSGDGEYFGTAPADAGGHFLFSQVPPGTYAIRVWPYDKNGDGVAEFQLYTRCLGSIDTIDDSGAEDGNLTALSLVLEAESSAIVASSFQNLTTDNEDGYGSDGYPWSTGTVNDNSFFIPSIGVECSGCGVGGTLIGANPPIWLQFGAVVDPTSAIFELVDMDVGNGSSTSSFGTPMKISVSWANGVIATITVDPTNPLLQTSDPHRRYQLRIKSLQFADASFFIDPRSQAPGKVTFDYVSTPVYLPNPAPALFFDNYIGYTSAGARQNTTHVAVDADTFWALDANNDFVGGDYSPGDQFAGVEAGTGFQLKWQHQAGATNYKMYARNSTTNGNIGDNKRLWRQVNGSLQFDVDPNGQTTVVAFGVMGFSGSFATLNDFGAIWNAPGGGQNCEKITPTIASGGCAQTLHYPFLFGNPIQVAVTSIDKDGYESPIDPSKTLTMQDTFGPLVETSSQGMVARLTSDFRTSSNSSLKNNIVQRGQTFRKVMIVPWSEPLVTTTAPIFTSRGGQVTIVQQGTTVWDPFTALDQPINISDANGTPLTLSVPGACTEVMVARTGVPVGVNPLRGDTIIPVRNAGLFSVSASARVVFINPGYGSAAGSGAWIDEITGISAVDAANNRITLALGLQNSVPADALVCLVDAPATAAQNVISVGGTGGADVAVNNASMFMYGQTVALYRPQTGGNPDQIFEFFTVSGMDTVASPNFITLSGVPNAGQNTTSVIFPLPVGMTRYGSFAGVLYSGSCCFRGEYQLRTQNDLSSLLMTDVIGGNNTVVTLTGPASFLSVGDTVLFDMDGDLLRTFNGSNAAFADQFFTTVKAIQFDASATTPTWSFTVDLPAGAVYIHGQSRVIALGDAFSVTGVQDTSATATSPHTVNTHQDTFTADTCPDCENGSVY